MIIPSQHASRVARAAAGGGGGGDVTPNAVNWTDVAAPGGFTNTQTITGINTTINLRIDSTGYGGTGAFDVYKNDSQTSLANEGTPFTLSVSNNDQIYFYASSSQEQTISVTVTNASDENTVLDTFTLNTGEGGGGG